MAEAAVTLAVETLGKLLIDKAVFLQGVKEEVVWLRDELKRMQCFLKDATKKQSVKEAIRNWISDIRKVAHDAEDAIEMFVLNVESRGTVSRLACFPKHLNHLNKVGEEIESIRKRLTAIEDSRVRYGIQDLGRDDRQRVESPRPQLEVEARRRLSYWKEDKQVVVGMENDVKLLLGKAILEKSERLSVAAISGMGGMGKSTLARKIFNHPDVVPHFDHRVWVVVSSEFTPQGIMKKILEKLGVTPDELKLLESDNDILGHRDNLKEELHKRLTGKRYFIVLDDVWEAAHWESLSGAFPDEDKASRLLLTSRNEGVTKHDGYVHKMKVLDAKQSRELFLRKAFVDDTNAKCPDELMNVGEEILRKCGGLPLAISVVGSLLAKRARDKSEWEKVLAEMKDHLDRSTGDINITPAILELSYQNLPPDLKACFLGLAFSREDATLKAMDLVHIWVAQGLVRQEVVREGEVMEDVAREYLNELISRNMIQVKEMEYDQVKACHMHDLIRELCIRKAKEEIDFEEVRDDGNSHQALHKPRHRAIYSSGESYSYITDRNHCLRSLFIHYDNTSFYSPPSSYWKSFELLRVLDVGSVGMRRCPKTIGRLTGLRYLKLKWRLHGLIELPRSWAKLKNLEVLQLKGFRIVVGTDKVIAKMDSLRHLYISTFVNSNAALQGMRNLQTLRNIKVKDSDLWHIQGMSSVSNLGFDLSEISDTTKLFTCLATLENLVCLTLKRNWRNPIDIEGISLGALHRITHLRFVRFFLMGRLPVNFPPNLSHLTFKGLTMSEDPMPVLETLPKLLYLKLSHVLTFATTMVVSSHGFPSLRVLHLDDMFMGFESIDLTIEQDAMPELKQFIVSRCEIRGYLNFPEHIKSAMAN